MAAYPLHWHTLGQLVVDAGLVALAYFLAYRLRFDQAIGTPDRYQELMEATIGWVAGLAFVLFALLRVDQKQWRYLTQRDLSGVFQSIVLLTLALIGVVALFEPVVWRAQVVTVPTGVLALFSLLSLLFVGGVGALTGGAS